MDFKEQFQGGAGKMNDVMLLEGPDGKLALCLVTPGGVFPMVTFRSLEELRKFSMGLLGYCSYFRPEVPKIFEDAFSGDENA